MKLSSIFRYILSAVLVSFIMPVSVYCAMPASNYDTDSWVKLSISEQEKVLENLRFEMLHERNNNIQSVIDQLQSIRSVRTELSSNNLLGIPLKAGNLELKALFKKARGQILVCTAQKIEAVLDSYKLVAQIDPSNPAKVIATITDDDPQTPAEPVTAKIATSGKTARVTAGADWIEFTYEGNGSYTCRTNKVPVKITARFID